MSVEQLKEQLDIPFHQVLVGDINLCEKLRDRQRMMLETKPETIGTVLAPSPFKEIRTGKYKSLNQV